MNVILITGGANGIGLATVETFLKHDVRIVCFDRDEHALAQLARRFGDERLLPIVGDVASSNETAEAVQQALLHFGRLDGVICNAAVYQEKNLLTMTESDWDAMLAVNLTGVALTIKPALEIFVKQQSGHILLIASDQAMVSKPNSFAYTVTKGAITQMVKSIALDFGPHHIRANAICPGTIRTPMTEQLVKDWALESQQDEPTLWQRLADEHPLGRVGTPEDVANLAHFLFSDKATFITGGCYLIDGGANSGFLAIQ